MNSDRPQCFELTTHRWQGDTGLDRLPTGILVSGLPAAFLSRFQVHNTRQLPLNKETRAKFWWHHLNTSSEAVEWMQDKVQEEFVCEI